MLYQTGCSGKTLWLSIDDVLNMSVEDELYLTGYSSGEYISSPSFGSVLKSLAKEDAEELDDPCLEEIEDDEGELFSCEDLTDLMENDSYLQD